MQALCTTAQLSSTLCQKQMVHMEGKKMPLMNFDALSNSYMINCHHPAASPTLPHGVMALCLRSSLSWGESLQRAAIISLQAAEGEEVL